jgi:Kef-type K+ transport system membrane component KefB
MNTNFQPGYPSKRPPALNIGLIVTVGSQIGLALIGIIFLALIIGLGIDELLQTEKHPFTILLFLGSVPFSLVITYWLAKRATKNLISEKSVINQTESVEEDDKRG